MTTASAARQGTGLMAEAMGASLGAILGAVAGVRRGKAVHPEGAVYDGRLVVPGGRGAPPAAELLSEPGDHRAVVRFSRSIGLPRPLPDLLGLSLRVVDAYGAGRHQDVLMVTSVDRPVLHHLFLPATDVQHRPYSSSLPYRAGAHRFLVGALPQAHSPRPPGRDEFERLAAAASTGELAFDIAVARVSGRFRPVAELRVGGRLPDELDALRFNPVNTGGGMELVGALNGARDRAYRFSQAAWRRTRNDGAASQEGADRRLEALALNSPGEGSDRRFT